MRTRVAGYVIVALIAAACTAGQEPTPTPVIRQPDPASATPPPGYLDFVSTGAGYRSCYPRGWHVREDWTGLPGAAGDAFVGGEPGSYPEVASFLTEPAPGYESERYADIAIQNLRAAGVGVELLGTTTVDSVSAALLRSSRLTNEGQRYIVQQAVWARDGRGWVLAISSSVASEEPMRETMMKMLACFRGR